MNTKLISLTTVINGDSSPSDTLSILKEHNIIVLPGSQLDIHPSVDFDISGSARIVLGGRIVFKKNAVLKADDTLSGGLMIIENSTLDAGARVINSNISNTLIKKGGQIIQASVRATDKWRQRFGPTAPVLIVKPGDSYLDANFAGLRGGVVNRVHLKLSRRLIVGTGQSLISSQEFVDRVLSFRENIGKPVHLVKNLGQNLMIIFSQFSHPQNWDKLYEPYLARKISFSTRHPDFPERVARLYRKQGSTLFVDMSQIKKVQNSDTLPQEIIQQSRLADRVVFKSREGHFVEVIKDKESS